MTTESTSNIEQEWWNPLENYNPDLVKPVEYKFNMSRLRWNTDDFDEITKEYYKDRGEVPPLYSREAGPITYHQYRKNLRNERAKWAPFKDKQHYENYENLRKRKPHLPFKIPSWKRKLNEAKEQRNLRRIVATREAKLKAYKDYLRVWNPEKYRRLYPVPKSPWRLLREEREEELNWYKEHGGNMPPWYAEQLEQQLDDSDKEVITILDDLSGWTPEYHIVPPLQWKIMSPQERKKYWRHTPHMNKALAEHNSRWKRIQSRRTMIYPNRNQ